MSDDITLTQCMERLKDGDEQAAHRIWDHFFIRLVEHARSRMQGIATEASDEEDIALSALKSLCIGIQNGRFHDLEDSNSLWRMLIVICRRKVSNQRTFQHRAKRDIYREQRSVTRDDNLDFPNDRELTPDLVVEFTENLAELLELLNRQELKNVALLRMQGFTVEEIARKLDCSHSTVERKLRTIRSIWKSRYESL